MAWFAYDESAALGATAQDALATPLRYPQALWVAALCVLSSARSRCRGSSRCLQKAIHARSTARMAGAPRSDELDDELEDMKARGVTADALPKGMRHEHDFRSASSASSSWSA